MLDFLLKRADYHDTLSVCSIPVAKAGHTAGVMMTHVKIVLQAILRDPRVGAICLAYDNASNFRTLNDVLLGESLPPALASDTFWAACEVVVVASGVWQPRALVVKRPTDGLWQVVFGGNDPAHCLKIATAQMRTAAKTIMLGELAVDCTCCLASGVNVSAYQGKDRQSDREAATLLVFCCPAPGTSLHVSGCGTLVFAFVVTACLAPWFDPHLSRSMRQHLSAFALYFLHVARQYVRVSAEHTGMRAAERNRRFLDPVAFRALTSCCSHMLARTYFWDRGAAGMSPTDALGGRSGASFVPSEQQERAAEHHFSRLRARFAHGQLRVKDYIIASAALARKSMEQLNGAPLRCSACCGLRRLTGDADWQRADELAVKSASLLFSRCCADFSYTQARTMLMEALSASTGATTEDAASAEGGE